MEIARLTNEKEEAKFIFEQIQHLRSQDVPLNEIAVLSRFGKDSTITCLERMMLEARLPYVKVRSRHVPLICGDVSMSHILFTHTRTIP